MNYNPIEAAAGRYRADVPYRADQFGLEKRLRTGEEAGAYCRSSENTVLPRSRRAGSTGRGYATVGYCRFPVYGTGSFVSSTWERCSAQDRSRAHFGEGFSRALGRIETNRSPSGSVFARMCWNNGRLAYGKAVRTTRTHGQRTKRRIRCEKRPPQGRGGQRHRPRQRRRRHAQRGRRARQDLRRRQALRRRGHRPAKRRLGGELYAAVARQGHPTHLEPPGNRGLLPLEAKVPRDLRGGK